MKEPADLQLVVATLADSAAYGALVRRYQPILRRYVQRILGRSNPGSDDVLQDIFIKAFLNLNDFDQNRGFAPWIYRIAHNEAVSHLRKSGSGIQMVNGEDAKLFLEQIADAETPGTLFWKQQSSIHVHSCLAALDAKYRDVLVLRYLEEQSYDDIAEILHLPPGTVATLIKRGLERLRETYRSTGDLP